MKLEPFSEIAEVIARDNCILEMVYADQEKKFIRLGLDPAAQGREVDNSGAMLFKSLRKRGVKSDAMIDGETSGGESEDDQSASPFLTRRDWMNLKPNDTIWFKKGSHPIFWFRVRSNDFGTIRVYSIATRTERVTNFQPNLWHLYTEPEADVV